MAQVHVDHMSQPARALLLFIRLNGLPVEEKMINIGRQQHKSKEYLAVFPLGKVPCYTEGDWLLPESAAILRYLASAHSGSVADHWYPENRKARATVEAAMDWHHGNVRKGSAMLVWHHVIAPMNKLKGSTVLAKHGEFVLQQSLEAMESFWLRHTKFVAGDQISIADLLLCTELAGLRLLDGAIEGKDMEAWLAPHSKVVAWMAAVREATLPAYDDVHALLHKAAARFKQRRLAADSKL